MNEKTYDAIYKIAKSTESDVIVLWVGHVQITGLLLDCNESKCAHGIVTLQDATVKCMKHKYEAGESMSMQAPEKHFRWLNIPACHIIAFTFECCLIDEE